MSSDIDVINVTKHNLCVGYAIVNVFREAYTKAAVFRAHM